MAEKTIVMIAKEIAEYYPPGCQKTVDMLCDVIEAMQTELVEEQRVRRNAVNELCHKCGRYREEHNGACDGCRWHHAKA